MTEPDVPRVSAVDRPVHEMVAAAARRWPDAVAVDGGALRTAGATCSYRDLVRGAETVAAHLHALGVAPGRAVAIWMPAGARQVAASVGVLMVGCHLVWLGTGDVGQRSRLVLADLVPACLLVDGWPAPQSPGPTPAGPVRGHSGGPATLILDMSTWDTPMAAPATVHTGLDEIAYVAYTSGSTGRPKGVAQTHAALGQFASWMARDLGIGPGSRVAQWVAPDHDPSLCEAFATLVSGGTLCPVPDRIRAHPERFVGWLAAQRITFLQTVPSFARELLAVLTDRGPGPHLAGLDRLVLMGEALPGHLVDGLRAALPGTRLTNIYGPTETIAATWYDITGPHTGPVPIGRPIPGRQVLVLDALDRPCPTGVTGQIVIRSRYAANGYRGGTATPPAFRPLADAGPAAGARSVAGAGSAVAAGSAAGASDVRCYRTGDLGRWRPDGLLEFRGRQDRQVKVLGTRIELDEVEATLAEHDSVAECAVVGLTDADGLVNRLMAYVVARPAVPASPAVWRAHLRERFGGWLPLAELRTLTDPLPRNVAGKVDRARLPAP